MDLKLSGKVALVSGSTGGIGLAIVTTLAEEGATVIVNGRTQERVNNAIAFSKQSLMPKFRELLPIWERRR